MTPAKALLVAALLATASVQICNASAMTTSATLSICADAACPVADADLEQVQVVFRHSYRGPFLWNPYLNASNASYSGCQAAYPGFPLNITDEVDGGPGPHLLDLCKPALPGDGSCREGWLTPAGYQAAQRLGQYLRSTYVSDAATPRLVASQFNPEAVWAHATPYHRTSNTMRGVLTGLFPAEAAAGVSATVMAVDSSHEYMYSSPSFCPPLKSLLRQQEDLALEKLARDPEVQRQAAVVMEALNLAPVNFSAFGGDCGAPKVGSPCWIQAYDILATSLANGHAWPRGADKGLYDLINRRASEASFNSYPPSTRDTCLLASGNCTANLAYSGLGSLVWRLLGNMLNVASASPCGVTGFPRTSGCPAKPPPKLLLYAGHDNTQFGLLAVLAQRTPTTWPWYASHFEFELWRMRSTGERYVRIFFNGKALRIDGTASVMPLSQFQDLVAQYVVPQQAHQDFCWPGSTGSTSGAND